MLALKNIVKEYKQGNHRVKAIDDFSISFRRQEFVSIIGPSGCGKTTLLNVIGGLDRYTSGEINIDGKITSLFQSKDWDAYRNHKVGFVFQQYQLIQHLSVYDNIALTLTLSGYHRKKRRELILEALEKVDMISHKDKKPKQLSGGEMQRIAIARAIVNRPSIILADEPTGALDSNTALEIVSILKELSKDTLVIMVTHNEQIANMYSDRKVYLKDGKLVTDTNPFINVVTDNKISKQKSAMPFWSSLVLSGKNLFQKRFRTLLTILSGSIGIVGVTVVLVISNGVNIYMEDIQKATLSNYPITIRSVAPDPPIDEEQKQYTLYTDEEKIFITNRFRSYLNHVNVFTPQFLDYLGDIDSNLYNVIDYRTGLDMKIITKVGNTYRRVTTSRFVEMSDDIDYIATQYDVLYGSLPTEANQLAILVDRYNTIDVTILNSLGIDFTGLDEFTFEEITQKEYRVIRNNDYFYKTVNGNYASRGTQDFESLYENSTIPLQITGIVRVAKNATTNIYDNGVLYSTKLRHLVIADSLESDIVLEQKEYGLTRNVLTNLPFEDEVSLTLTITKEYRYESQLALFTAVAQINTIRIYTDTFRHRIEINDYLKAYNENRDFEDRILYSDQMGNITREFDTFVMILTRVLIAFSAISLLVSTVMIGILTYVSVMERRKEIGILRSLGARKLDIARIFNTETMLIGLLAGVIGVILGILLIQPIIDIFSTILEQNNIKTLDLSQLDVTRFNPWFVPGIIASSIVLTLLAGSIPSLLAALKSPVDAMKTE